MKGYFILKELKLQVVLLLGSCFYWFVTLRLQFQRPQTVGNVQRCVLSVDHC